MSGLIAVDLFSGLGGMALGFARAGFDVVAVDNDPDAVAAMTLNAGLGVHEPIREIIHADARTLALSELSGHVSVLTAGPPCQPFSRAGTHSAWRDERNLFPALIRAIRECAPSVVVVENVPGLLRPEFRSYFNYIRGQLRNPRCRPRKSDTWRNHSDRLARIREDASEYNVHAEVLDAADFGAPQTRKRVFIVATRGASSQWTFPPRTHSGTALTRAQADGSYWTEHGIPRRKSTRREVNEAPERHRRWLTVRDLIKRSGNASLGLANTVYRESDRGTARAYKGHRGSALDRPAKTLKAGVNGSPGGENMYIDAKGIARYFTVTQMLALQGFPVEMHLPGSLTGICRLVGNAVAVQVSTAIAESTRESL